MPQSADSATSPPSERTATSDGGHAGRGEQAAQRAGLDEVVAGVDEDDVPGVAVEQAGQLGGHHAHLVAEQPQGGQHLGRGLARRGHEYESHVVSSRSSSTALSR